ncbi:hypothetical protein F4774DRAFT_406875 [Daldinia eschscholtzii]|nr:hypothetical protein F4774DRAFT_406875 [Daldinia eschscholtzii]
MAPRAFSSILGLAVLFALAPLTIAQQPQPSCFPVPVTLGNITNTTPTQTSNHSTLIVEADTPPNPGSSAPPSKDLRIVDEDPTYKYVGCWSEVTLLDPEVHALDGPFLTAPGLMNVHVCVDFCRHASNRYQKNMTGYRYAGLEYSFQCWCGDHLSKHSYHLIDAVCDLPCDGANTTACGGHLAMTLYNITEKKSPGDNNGFGGNGTGVGGNQPKGPDGQAALQAVGVGILVLAVTFALGWGCL